MKYKLLLAGKNQTIMDDFFYAMTEDFECLSTSIRSEDVINHVNYFRPDAFVYCISPEPKDTIMKLIMALRMVGRKSLKMIIIGDQESCNEFTHVGLDMVSLIIYKPTTAAQIREKILHFFNEQNIAEQKAREEQLRKKKEEEAFLRAAEGVFGDEAGDALAVNKEDEKKHVLVIDDDPLMLNLIKSELKDIYNVATAINGRIGLGFLERKRTDLILLDYEMPGQNGLEVMERILANEKTKDIPVVFLTGINDREKIRKVISMKPQGYLLKPIERDNLIQTIRKLIG